MIPKYLKLRDIINEKISSGEYPLGSKLPTEVQLAEEYEVSRSTVRQTLRLLQEAGIISKHWGSGNTVIAKSDSSKGKIVRVILPHRNYSFYENLAEDVEATLLKNGFQIELLETGSSLAKERGYLLEMLNDVYGGLIIMPCHSSLNSTNGDLMQLLLKRQTPIVFLNSAPNNIYSPTIITADNYSRGYYMARNFINEGYKNLGGIFLHDDICSTTAYLGFVDAIRDANLEILDSCLLFVNSVDYSGMISRSDSTINKFLKAACQKADAIYVDDNTLYSENAFPVSRCNLYLSKSIGKEAAKALISLKKNGNSQSITIPYK